MSVVRGQLCVVKNWNTTNKKAPYSSIAYKLTHVRFLHLPCQIGFLSAKIPTFHYSNCERSEHATAVWRGRPQYQKGPRLPRLPFPLSGSSSFPLQHLSACGGFDAYSPPLVDWTFDVRPARNAWKPVWGQFNHLIYMSMLTPTHRTMHGRRVFIFFSVPSAPPVSQLLHLNFRSSWMLLLFGCLFYKAH